ncbi:MAG: hypothetical protein IT336_02540 [Thermomicrobiales bacterium]|nr:hypothetical protein [Thermomicrobiales bacterium]
MMHDLAPVAGFHLKFNPATLNVDAGDGLSFAASSRLAADLDAVLQTPDDADAGTELYRLYALAEAPAAERAALDRLGLTYSLVLMPPGRIGREFPKTAGHYHPTMPESHLAYPEVYTQLHGKFHLLLQRRDAADPERVADCAIVEMNPGFTIVIPPGYAHVLINTTDAPALMAGLYAAAFRPDYAPVRRRRGLAHYIVAGPRGQVETIANPNYSSAPPLRWLTEPLAEPFAPIDPGEPVWRSFARRPDAYAFLTDPDAASRHFVADSGLEAGEEPAMT